MLRPNEAPKTTDLDQIVRPDGGENIERGRKVHRGELVRGEVILGVGQDEERREPRTSSEPEDEDAVTVKYLPLKMSLETSAQINENIRVGNKLAN